MNDRLKLSREEVRLGLFIVNHRKDDMRKDVFEYCQDVLCDTAGKEPRMKERICELLIYVDQRETLEKFRAWTPPKFPVNGIKLLEMGVPKGPKLAKMINALREKWKDSRYTYTEEDLLEFVEKLKDTIK